MGPVERELRKVSDEMLQIAARDGIWFANYLLFDLSTRPRAMFSETGTVTVDDWSEAIEAAEALGL